MGVAVGHDDAPHALYQSLTRHTSSDPGSGGSASKVLVDVTVVLVRRFWVANVVVGGVEAAHWGAFFLYRRSPWLPITSVWGLRFLWSIVAVVLMVGCCQAKRVVCVCVPFFLDTISSNPSPLLLGHNFFNKIPFSHALSLVSLSLFAFVSIGKNEQQEMDVRGWQTSSYS